MEPKIIYEDNSLIVCYKPPKWPVQEDPSGDLDLKTYLENYMIQEKNYENPYIGVVHRLDRPVGGLVLFSKNPKTSHKLSLAFQNRTIKKSYLAIVEGIPKDGTWKHPIKKRFKTNTSHVVDSNTPKAKEAIMSLETLQSLKIDDMDYSLVRINLETGRHHQIRVQCAHMNHPLWGDTKYNPNFQDLKGWHQIALFAEAIDFIHPKTNRPMSFKCLPEDYPFSLFNLENLK